MENVFSERVIKFEQLDFRPVRYSEKIRTRKGPVNLSNV